MRSLVLLSLLASAAAAQTGSLWPVGTAGERSMYADHKASRAGDILTVVVSESATAQNNQSKTSNRESSIEDAVQQFLFSVAAGGIGSHKGEFPATSMAGKGSNSGGGTVNNSQSLTSRAAVMVTDVLANGNLVIEGVRIVTFSGETQYVVLHGLVRPDDIGATNVVFSSNIADARVEFLTEGALTDAQKRGWLTKLYEKLRPL